MKREPRREPRAGPGLRPAVKRIGRALLLAVALAAAVFAAGKPVSDDFISDSVRQKLAADTVVKGGAIEVIVKDGAVVLRGKVEEEKQKNRAEKIAKKVGGVKSVTNEIQIARP